MPWPKDHTSQTRRKIVAAASTALRADGISRVRIEDVMTRAGLTHGGFYAHFDSKADLLREALVHAAEETIETLSKPLAGMPNEERWRTVIDSYLSPAHVAHPEAGCPLATVGPEIVRADSTTRKRLAGLVKERLTWMRQLLPQRRRKAISDECVIGSTACMVGGVILARAVSGKEAGAILGACREFIHQREC
jgi:TetR/AcrR family transcriptional repressor of nem operon